MVLAVARMSCHIRNLLLFVWINFSLCLTLQPSRNNRCLHLQPWCPIRHTRPTRSQTNDDDEALIDPLFVQRNQWWVVIVDDEEAIRMAIGDYLYDRGYQVTACSDAEALLDVCRQPRESGQLPRIPDAIVSDVRMPGTDGMQLLQQLKADDRLRMVPVILLTAKAMKQDRIAGYTAGADAYIPKPFDPEELVAILDNRILRRRQLVQTSEDSQKLVLKQELMNIKELMKQQSTLVVEQTDVYLTLAEREVLALLAKGYTNAEIATERGIGVPQVTRIIGRLYSKTGMETRTQLLRWGIKTGYIPPR